MRRKQFLVCACSAALVAGCSDDESKSRTLVMPNVPAPARITSRPARALPALDSAIEIAIKKSLRAEVARVAAADPNWQTYPTLTDDSRRSEIPDDEPSSQVIAYLRGLTVRVPVDVLEDVKVTIDPDRVELTLVYPTTVVALVDASESEESRGIPKPWLEPRPVISDERWKEMEGEVALALGDGGSPADLSRRIGEYRQGSQRWDHEFRERFDSRIKVMKGALWSAPEHIDRGGVDKAYSASRLLMIKPAVIASIAGPADVPIVPVLGGPVFGLVRGRVGKDPEVNGSVCGADGVWIDVHIRSTHPSKPLADSEAWVNTWFDTLRPFEQRKNDAATVSEKMKAALRSTEPSASRRAVLLALSSFHLHPTSKRAEMLVHCWRRKLPAPSDAEVAKLVDQIVAWAKLGPKGKRDLDQVANEKILPGILPPK